MFFVQPLPPWREGFSYFYPIVRLLIVEPFYGGSHKQFVDGLMQHNSMETSLLQLSGHHWKWRMHGAAITLAEQFLQSNFQPDIVLASDMLDLSLFSALCKARLQSAKKVLYFHENQLTYPWSPKDRDKQKGRDNHYSFINYSSALVADQCLFNSNYHLESFLTALEPFLRQFPDANNLFTVDQIKAKSSVLHLALDLSQLELMKPISLERPKRAVILWNHRWEYDKNPEGFFRALFELQDRGIEFHLVVVGEELDKRPAIFDEAKEILKDKIMHWGYCEAREDYIKWLWLADILPVTSNQDFFGGSIIEAVYCNTIPLLPKRLAYPEHFTEPWQRAQFFYDNEQDLVNRLQRYCMDVNVLRKQQTQAFVAHYDWANSIKKYEKALQLGN